MPEYVECSGCGQVRKTVRRVFARHSQFQTGPECYRSGQTPSAAELVATRNYQRAQLVMHWASVLRDDDPAHVQRWVKMLDREELEAMLMTALVAIPDGMSVGQAFEWVRGLGA